MNFWLKSKREYLGGAEEDNTDMDFMSFLMLAMGVAFFEGGSSWVCKAQGRRRPSCLPFSCLLLLLLQIEHRDPCLRPPPLRLNKRDMV